MQDTQRNIEVDTIRTFALIGICVVNIPFLALPLEAQISPPTAGPDRIAAFMVEMLFQGKFFLLFSFIFGWGLHVQDMTALWAGKPFGARYLRRLAGLAVIGIAHALLVFSGDILVLYALLGAVIWPLRKMPPRALLRFAAAMIPVAALAMMLVGLLLSDPARLPGPVLTGGFVEAALQRLYDWPPTFLFVLLFNGPLALGAFAVGIAAAKTDFFGADNPEFARLSRAWPLLALAGLAINVVYALTSGGFLPDPTGLLALLGLVLLAVGAPVLSALYLVAIIHFARAVRPGSGWLAAGRNSLSGYVAQGVIAGLVFGGYGLGLFGKPGPAVLLVISLAIAGLVMLLAAYWTRYAPRGPLEHLLRVVTRGPEPAPPR
jgi:uncharacterized protein